jgi:hypothetical protein
MTREQLIILVGTALVLLINFIRRMRQRRVQGEAPRRQESDVSERPQPARRTPPVVAPRRLPAVPDTTPVPPARPRVVTRPRARAPLGGLRAVRHGIVLMTILGPCRALEPPDPQA